MKHYDTARLRRECLVRLGSRCNWPGCGWTDPRALQIDHIHGGGYLMNNRDTYLEVLELSHPERRYQVLCANHNWVKRYENNEVRLGKQTAVIRKTDILDWGVDVGGKPKSMTLLFKCEDCGQLFEENQNGLSDTGQTRPMCPRCFEEIDIVEIGNYESDAMSDSTGDPY